jgi:hypothetical protein
MAHNVLDPKRRNQMPEDPDDRGPQHTGEVPPQPNERAWKKRKPGETKPSQPETDADTDEQGRKKADENKRQGCN